MIRRKASNSKLNYFVRDLRNELLGWFETHEEAQIFIKKHDPYSTRKMQIGKSS
jgi:hypothetical protein